MAALLRSGDTAPWFTARVLDGNPHHAFSSCGGRHVVLLFLGSAALPPAQAMLAKVAKHRALFDDDRACLFGVSADPADAATGRIGTERPGIRWILDHDGAVSRLYGAVDEDDPRRYRPHWLLLDPMLRVVAQAGIDQGEAILASLSRALAEPVEPTVAPVLVLPRVVEPPLCAKLIDAYNCAGGTESGFMRERNGITVAHEDHRFKRRSDHLLEDGPLKSAVRERLNRHVRPMLRRAFQFDATRVERYLVAHYDADEGGFFRPHRDNTTAGTAHRRFACTINLNPDDYEGGDLRFPEYGARAYRAPLGGAVIFSCSLLHEALPVTRGHRYALLPFFYDDPAALQRERNTASVSPEFAGYRAG